MKKGNKSWKPASTLATFKKKPGYGYKYVRDDTDNIARHLAEGWEFANETVDPKVQTDVAEQIDPITRGRKVRELVLMRMDNETRAARAAHFQEKTDQQERGIKANLQRELGAEGPALVHGEVEIETIE